MIALYKRKYVSEGFYLFIMRMLQFYFRNFFVFKSLGLQLNNHAIILTKVQTNFMLWPKVWGTVFSSNSFNSLYPWISTCSTTVIVTTSWSHDSNNSFFCHFRSSVFQKFNEKSIYMYIYMYVLWETFLHLFVFVTLIIMIEMTKKLLIRLCSWRMIFERNVKRSHQTIMQVESATGLQYSLYFSLFEIEMSSSNIYIITTCKYSIYYYCIVIT